MSEKLSETIYDNVMQLLIQNRVTPDGLEMEISKMKAMFESYYPGEEVNTEELLRKILYDFGVFEGSAKVLEDNRDHQEWLADERASIKWDFWNRYKKYLEIMEKLPPAVVANVDETTEEVLKRLESPRRNGSWDRRGMVVGNVQSGKTSNYTGLISKAVDSGYKIVIVLAGLNNDLRSQTQKRIDKGFIGKDTRKKESYDQTSSKIGAGLLPGFYEPPIIAVTSADTNGDFKKSVHNSVTITPGGDPIIAVVKKNVTPLKNLLNWFTGENNSGKINNIPLLLIDDEADNASIDTKAIKRIGNAETDVDDLEQDPTKINGLTPYYATDIINKYVYMNVPSLLKYESPELFVKYKKMVEDKLSKTAIVLYGFNEMDIQNKTVPYESTDIYKVSRKLKQMQKLNHNILSTWTQDIKGMAALPENIDRNEGVGPVRVGMTLMMNCGMEATVIEDFGYKDITVRFEDGLIRHHRRRDKFIKGSIAHCQDKED